MYFGCRRVKMPAGSAFTFVGLVWLLYFSSWPHVSRANEEALSQDEYSIMPPLFLFENVTECLSDDGREGSGLYCTVKTVVQPDDASEVWRAIEKFSKRPSYHEHALLDRGLCVEPCARLVESLDPSEVARFDSQRITIEPYTLLTIPSEAEALAQYRAKYGRILNICANYHIWQRYKLTGYSELERCVTPATQRPTMDAYHASLFVIACILIALVVYATLVDFRAIEKICESDPLWMEFSVRRTWAQLVAEPRARLQRDFAFVEFFRVLSVFAILGIHATMIYTAGATANIRPMEEFFDHPVSRMLASIFPFQVHTFFTISGVMLAVHFVEQATAKAGGRIGWSYYGKAVVMRYLRVFPSLFVLWLYQASWIDRLSEGPGDYRFIELEKDNCRTNGWLNFLFLNNYFKYGNMCLQQSWYLAADFQFFLVGVPFLLLINRHPRLTKPLITGAAAFSLVAPILNLYYTKLPGVILISFKQLRFVFYIHKALMKDYMLSHAHTCSYFAGIFAGLAYHRFRDSSNLTRASRKKLELFWRIPTALVLLQASLAPLFYDLNYNQPMLWNAIYGAVHRCSWGAMCAVGILRGATVWQRRNARIYFHPVLLALSRLSFGVFMVQFSVMKSLGRNASGEGVPYSGKIYFETVLYSWIGCYGAALLLALLVELPIAAIGKRVFGSKHRPRQGKETEDKSS